MRKPCVFKSSWGMSSTTGVYWMERSDEDERDDEVPMVTIYSSQNSNVPLMDEVPLNVLDMAPKALVH